MSIKEYLQGLFEYEFSEQNLQSALVGRGLVAETLFVDVSEKDRDLAQSDLYIVLANATSGGGKHIQKGNRAVTVKSYSFSEADRKRFKYEAIRLRHKWGEATEMVIGVKFSNMFGR